MKSAFPILFVGAAAAMFLVRPAEAAKQPAVCDLYADVAVTMAEVSDNLKCNFSGPLWSRNRNDHFLMCMAAKDPETEEKLSDLRENGIRACITLKISEPDSATKHSQAPDAGTCEKYALVTENQQAENIAKGCGYEGPAWHADRQRHMNWCGSVDAGYVNSIADARKEMLNQCALRR